MPTLPTLRRARVLRVAAALVLALLAPAAGARAAELAGGWSAAPLPIGPIENALALQVAGDGTTFFATRDGRVLRLASPTSPASSAQVVADLREQVHFYGDRGLLGLAVDPDWPTKRRLFVLYTAEQALAGTRTSPPALTGSWGDDCPGTSGARNGCVVSGRLSRLDVDAAGRATERVLVQDWCQQFDSHSIGALAFGPDGQLYASAGDGASYAATDWGQFGGAFGDANAVNPCGDPAGPAGATPQQPVSEGGMLRAQDVRTPGDPTGLSGSVIRVDPDTGAASAGNPADGDANARRIIAHGLRNPFRFALRPGTSELWIGDVGWAATEEVDRVPDVRAGRRSNFGWPCIEGDVDDPSFDGNALCDSLDPASAVRPAFSYEHGEPLLPDGTCPDLYGSAVAAMRFLPTSGGPFPARLAGGLVLSDYARGCLWVLPRRADGTIDTARPELLATSIHPVDLQLAPGRGLLALDAISNEVIELRHSGTSNRAPVARITRQPAGAPTASAAPPLSVDLDGSSSSDPDGGGLTYAWDLDGDGAFDDSTLADPPATTITRRGSSRLALRVTDPSGATGESSLVVRTDDEPPVPAIEVLAGDGYAIGEDVVLRGSASDAEDGAELNASRLSWVVVTRHCVGPGEDRCHEHRLLGRDGTAALTFQALDHPYPSFTVATLTATDSGGVSASTSVALRPRTTLLGVRTQVGGADVPGLGVRVGEAALRGGDELRTTTGGVLGLSVTAREQAVGEDRFVFSAWGDGDPASARTYAVPEATGSIVARFDQAPRAVVAPVVTGTPQAGARVEAGGARFVGEPAPAVSWRWESCDAGGDGCTAIPGADATGLELRASDVGRRMRVVATAANGVLDPAVAASAPTAPVVAAPIEAAPDAPPPSTTTEAAPPADPAPSGPPAPAPPGAPDVPAATSPSLPPTATAPPLAPTAAAAAGLGVAPRLGVAVRLTPGRQPAGALRLTLRCAGVPCRVALRPQVRLGRRAFAIPGLVRRVSPARPVRVTLRLPARTRAAIAAHRRRGGTASVALTATATAGGTQAARAVLVVTSVVG